MSLSPEILILLTMLIPLGAAGIIPLVGDRSANLREAVTFVAGVLLLFVVIQLCQMVAAGERPELFIASFAGVFEIRFRLEPLGATFAAIASSLWIVNSMFTLGYMRGNNEKHQTRFYVMFAVSLAATMGVAFAIYLVLLEPMTQAWGLHGLWGAVLGPPAIWVLPIVFPLVMAFGGATLGNALIYLFPFFMFRGAINKIKSPTKWQKREVKIALGSAIAGLGMGAVGAVKAVQSIL